MTTTHYLHFTFSPIQSFVAQARRTRDLWAGSYLISYLAGVAMQAIGKDRIKFPNVEKDDLLLAICKEKTLSSDFQRVGSLPNRFAANTDATGAKQAAKAIRETWERIAETVWKEKVERYATLTPDTRCIWNRQIQNFWDITWVIGEHRNMDSRKNLRNRLPVPEHGEKCSLCGERQEISGKGMGSSGSRKEMRAWWTDFAKGVNGATGLHLRMDEQEGQCNERLCAVCLTKRLFPLVAEKAIGWEVPVNFPSVSYVAAVDFLRLGLEKDPAQAAKFADTAASVGVDRSEAKIRNKGLSGVLKKRIQDLQGISGRKGWLGDWHTFVDLDGSSCFKDAIRGKDFGLSAQEQEQLIKALQELQKAAGTKASPFYAILFMDGDSMGALLDTCDDAERIEISNGIMRFSREVSKVVNEHDGWLIYAGGEDVFAFLPLDSALNCAAELRRRYREIFEKLEIHEAMKKVATISAAINYVSIQTGLQVAVQDTGKLLKDHAKDHFGRDALACRVWKRGGPILTWGLPWKYVLDIHDIATGTLPEEIKWRFQDETDNPSQFSSKFFYKLGDLLELLPTGMSEQEQIDLLSAEYLANRELDWKDKSDLEKSKEAKKRVARLLALCREQRREVDEDKITYEPGPIRSDGALLVRFLAQKGIE